MHKAIKENADQLLGQFADDSHLSLTGARQALFRLNQEPECGVMKRKSEMLMQQMNKANSAEGCNDASIQNGLNRFDMQARL